MKQLLRTFLLFSCLLPACAPAFAAETDHFSGSYQLRPSRQDPPIQLVLRKKELGYTSRVVAGNASGNNEANVESKFTLVTEVTLRRAMESLLPGSKPSDDMQCGSIGLGLFCHVKPGTTLAGSRFTARTGYFMLVDGLGAIEVAKLASADTLR